MYQRDAKCRGCGRRGPCIAFHDVPLCPDCIEEFKRRLDIATGEVVP